MANRSSPVGYTHSGDTAKILVLIGLVLQLVFVLVFAGIAGALLVFLPLGAFFLILAVFGVVWVVLVYLLSYRPIAAGDYSGAATPTLIFAILSLLTIALISGVLYLVAYVKLRDAEEELRQQSMSRTYPSSTYAAFTGPAPPYPASTRANPPRFCVRCGGTLWAGQRFCPNCAHPIS